MKAKYLSVLNVDEYLSTISNPTFINDLPSDTMQDRRRLNDLLITTYSSADVMSSVPSCLNGCTKYAYNIGVICPKCKTEVTDVTTRKFKPDLWIRKPNNIHTLINPIAFYFMCKFGHTAKFNAVEWFCNPRKQDPPANHQTSQSLVNRLLALNIPRGLNNFIKNFDVIIEALSYNLKASDRHKYLEFFKQNRDDLFCNHIPLPSRVAFIVEETSVGRYYDKAMDACLEAAVIATNLGEDEDVAMLEGRITTIMWELNKYYKSVIEQFLSKKQGWFRQLRYGSRMDMAFRNIITSLHEPHDYRTTFIPYSLGVTMLEPHLVNKLVRKHGHTMRSAFDFLRTHTNDMNPTVLELLDELVDESPDLGIKLCMTRYPSLSRTSTQPYDVIGWTEDETKVSVLTLVGSNADFDGDIFSGAIMPDKKTADAFNMLTGHYDIHSTTKPGTIKKNIALPDTVICVLFNWIDSEEMVI